MTELPSRDFVLTRLSPSISISKVHMRTARSTRAMAQALGVSIDWRSLTLDIPSYLSSAKLDNFDNFDKGGRKVEKSERSPQQWSGVKYAYADVRRYANLTEKTTRITIKIRDSSLAGSAML